MKNQAVFSTFMAAPYSSFSLDHSLKISALPRIRIDYLAGVQQNAKLWVTGRGQRVHHSSSRLLLAINRSGLLQKEEAFA
jgi:hypothetical protein